MFYFKSSSICNMGGSRLLVGICKIMYDDHGNLGLLWSGFHEII